MSMEEWQAQLINLWDDLTDEDGMLQTPPSWCRLRVAAVTWANIQHSEGHIMQATCH